VSYSVAGSAAPRIRIDQVAAVSPAEARIVCRPGATDAGIVTRAEKVPADVVVAEPRRTGSENNCNVTLTFAGKLVPVTVRDAPAALDTAELTCAAVGASGDVGEDVVVDVD
jgi:hypothetical protein